MPWFRVSKFDANGGSIGDLPPQAVPPTVFTTARNVRFTDGAVEKAQGMLDLFPNVPIAPYYLLPAQDNLAAKRLFIAGLNQIYAYINNTLTNVTRAVGGNYTASSENSWTGGVLHGIPYLNNGTNAPQSWDATSGKFVDLPNWPTGYSANALRPFKNFLVALNYTNGTTRFPHNILWSQPADPGSVPNSWDITDPTRDAGDAPLSDTPGHVIDGLGMGDLFSIYKEDATYTARFTGAPFIFTFKPVLRESGILARNCIGEVNGRHAVLTTDDVILFDGNVAESIMNRKWRRDLFSSLSLADYKKSFVVVMPDRREVWFCISTTAGYPPSVAYVWDWKTNSWSKRDLPFTQAIAYGFAPDIAGESWEEGTGNWDADPEAWSTYAIRGKLGVLAATLDTRVHALHVGENIADNPMTALVEHLSFDFATEEQPEPADAVKHISKIRPRILAQDGTVLSFQVGTQMHINDPIEWNAAQTFTVGQQDELCLGVNGRYISWRISSNCDCSWRMEAIDFLIQGGGRF